MGRQMSVEEAVELCEFVWPHTQQQEETQEQGRASEPKEGEEGEWQQTGVYGELLVYNTTKTKEKGTIPQPNSEKVEGNELLLLFSHSKKKKTFLLSLSFSSPSFFVCMVKGGIF